MNHENQHMPVDARTAQGCSADVADHVAERHGANSQFVDDVAHEMRTPIAAMQEFTSILRQELHDQLDDDQREFFALTSDCIEDLNRMVNDMLGLSRLQAGLLTISRKSCYVLDIVRRARPALERKAAASGVSLEINVLNVLPAVYCDAHQIERVIIGLMANAVRSSSEDGQVKLWARQIGEKASQITVGVTDNGPGIPPERLAAMREQLRSRDGNVLTGIKEFGLGFKVAKALVHLNFGQISIESQLGRGTTVSFTLPTADASSIVTHYLSPLLRSKEGSPQVSLVSAELGETVGSAASDELDELLEQRLGCDSLIFRAGPSITARPLLDGGWP